MTDQEASACDDELKALRELRENLFFTRHFLLELRDAKATHRREMNDRTKPEGFRCESITSHNLAEKLLEFCDVREAEMRAALREYDRSREVITRPFSSPPP